MHRLLLALAFPTTTLLAAEPDWTQWRGPTRDGIIHQGASAWPASITRENLTKLWSVDLDPGYSSPIVAGNRIFTVETKAKKDEVVRAFDRTTGKPLWDASWEGSMKVPFYAAKNGSWVRSTPATDGKTLFIGGMRDVLVALDVTTGKERWRRDYPAEEKTPTPSFGFVSSPLLDDEHIYVQVGTALRKIKKSDGNTVWQSLADERAMFGSAFSSPFRAKIHGKDQILVQTRSILAGISPDTGETDWSTEVEAFRGMNILPPTPIGNTLFTATYGGGSFLFNVAKNEKTQSVSKVWQDKKLEGYMSSPLVLEGKVYLHGRDQHFHCIEPSTGKTLWTSEEKFGEYCSLVANENRILALDQRGILLLIEANPKEFKLISSHNLDLPSTWAHLAVTGDKLYVRHLNGLNAYQWR